MSPHKEGLATHYHLLRIIQKVHRKYSLALYHRGKPCTHSAVPSSSKPRRKVRAQTLHSFRHL